MLTTAMNTSEVGHTAIPERVRIFTIQRRRGQSRWPGMVSLPPLPSLRNESEVLVCQVSTLGIWSLFDCDSRPASPAPPVTPSPFGPQNRFGLLVSVGTNSWRNLLSVR